jgi:hypothetical protein
MKAADYQTLCNYIIPAWDQHRESIREYRTALAKCCTDPDGLLMWDLFHTYVPSNVRVSFHVDYTAEHIARALVSVLRECEIPLV